MPHDTVIISLITTIGGVIIAILARQNSKSKERAKTLDAISDSVNHVQDHGGKPLIEHVLDMKETVGGIKEAVNEVKENLHTLTNAHSNHSERIHLLELHLNQLK